MIPNETNKIDDLILDYFTGKISEVDQCELFELLHSNPAMKAKFNEMAKLRAILFTPTLESEKAKNFAKLNLSKSKYIDFREARSRLLTISRVAAVTFIIAISSVGVYRYFDFAASNKDLYGCEISTPLGSSVKITLPDGSTVNMNSGSTIKYSKSFGSEKREVILTGEALFDIKKDPKKPFLVQAKDLQVKVLGTVFNVKSYGNEQTIEVNLLRGKIEASTQNGGSSKKVILKPNERIIYNTKTNILLKKKAEVSDAILWTVGKIKIENLNLEEIAKLLERKYNTSIEIGESIKEERFTGNLDLNKPIESVINFIDVDHKFKTHFKDNQLLIENN